VLGAYRAVDIVSEVTGKIATLRRDVGDAVKKDTRLASLDTAVLRETVNQADAALLAAQARFELAHDDFRRDSTLHATGDIAEAAFDASRMAYTSALADLNARQAARELAARDLREADIRSPFAGIVARRFVDIGTFVTPGASLFRVVDVDSLRLVLSVAQRNVARLTPGAQVMITAEALGDRRFSGTIRSISPEADQATGTFPVEVILANPPDRPLRDGLVVRAVLVLGALEDAIAIPREAILRRTGGQFAFVVADSVAEERSLTVGPLIGDRYVIESGLQAGETLVVVGAQNLQDGVRVVVEDEAVGAGEGTAS
jgi:RND family efflux transporter MFP subunit